MRNRRVTINALVWSCYVIILFDELSKQSFKMILAKHDHVVKQLSPQGSNESLHIWILPRTSIRSPDFLYATAVQKRSDAIAIYALWYKELAYSQKVNLRPKLLDKLAEICYNDTVRGRCGLCLGPIRRRIRKRNLRSVLIRGRG